VSRRDFVSERSAHCAASIQASFVPFSSEYLISAKGAAVILAWGSAPGIHATLEGSAESAIHFGALSRAFSARSGPEPCPWGDAPGCFDAAPLALNTNPSERGERIKVRGASSCMAKSPFAFAK